MDRMTREEDTRGNFVDPSLGERVWRKDSIKREWYITNGQITNEEGDRHPRKKT